MGFERFMFDDFAYSTLEELEAWDWKVRTAKGWPGNPSGIWERDLVRLVDDPSLAGNRLLQLSCVVGSSIRQSQVCHRRKYFEGTYAARVRFTSEPSLGMPGDQMVESFYGITPYERPFDPSYGELDFEYLPNGGWGLPPDTLAVTTWETVRVDPWAPRNESTHRSGDRDGWRTLVIQVADKRVNYFVDGAAFASHGDPNYPSSPMSINFNLWLIDGGQIESSAERVYLQDIDWVFYALDSVLSPDEVQRRVASFRAAGVRRSDNVPESTPPLDCPCNM